MTLRRGFVSAIALLLVVLTVSGCAEKKKGSPDQDLVRLVVDHHIPMVIDETATADDLVPFRDLATSHDVFVLNAGYRITDSFTIALALLKDAHALGYRYLMIDGEFTNADVYNRYLTTGDEQLITSMPELYGNFQGLNYLPFWRSVRAWNEGLPIDQRISVWACAPTIPTLGVLRTAGELFGSLPDPALVARLQGDWAKISTSYWDLKKFETQLREGVAGQTTPAVAKLLATVRLLKDGAAIKQSDNPTIKSNDYPGTVSIEDRAFHAGFEYYWQSRPAGGKVLTFMNSILDVCSAWQGGCIHTTYKDLLPDRVANIQCIPLVGEDWQRPAVRWEGPSSPSPDQVALDNKATAEAIAAQAEHQYMFIPNCREGDGHLFVRTVTLLPEIK